MTHYDDLPFKVERWTKGYAEPEETIAMCADLLSARAAFDAAVKRGPDEPLLLRHKARVIQKSLAED